MEKRVRSPNYPAFGLPEALEKVEAVYKAQHTHGAPREVVARGMGYNGLNGASATAISALNKYGLLDGRGDELKVSDRAMRILHPHSEAEKVAALRECAFAPALFRELAEKFPGPVPSDDILRNYLIRNGFSPSAVGGVILAYRETMGVTERLPGAYDSPVHAVTGEPDYVMPTQASAPPATASTQSAPHFSAFSLKGSERSLGRHDFDDGGFVQILSSDDLETEEALDWIEYLVKGKRRELERRKARAVARPSTNEDES